MRKTLQSLLEVTITPTQTSQFCTIKKAMQTLSLLFHTWFQLRTDQLETRFTMKIYRTLNRDFNDLFIFAFITRAMVKKDVWGNIRIIFIFHLAAYVSFCLYVYICWRKKCEVRYCRNTTHLNQVRIETTSMVAFYENNLARFSEKIKTIT